ncbi:MAG: Lrp/AsnC family transcriptional regulator [Candidatus Thorarchaeota archaeon]
MGSSEKVDGRDLAIIRLLLHNSRSPLREIGRHVKLSPSSVRNRITRLVEIGVIKRFTVDVDYRKLGYEIQVLVMITAKPGSSERLYRKLCDYEEVAEVFWTAGPANFVCVVRVKDMTQLSQFMTTELERLDSVEKVETIFLMPGPAYCRED